MQKWKSSGTVGRELIQDMRLSVPATEDARYDGGCTSIMLTVPAVGLWRQRELGFEGSEFQT